MNRDEMARQLARALPAWADREAVARSMGLRDVQLAGRAEPSWRLLLEAAEADGRTAELLAAAARRKPRDRVLATMAGFPLPVSGGSQAGRWVALGVLASVGLVGRLLTADPGSPPSAEGVTQPVVASVQNPAAPSEEGEPEPEAPEADDPMSAAAIAARLDALREVAPLPETAPSPSPSPSTAPAKPPPARTAAADRGDEEPPPVEVMQELAAVPRSEAERSAAVEAPAPAPTPPARPGKGVCGGRDGYAYVAAGKAPTAGALWVVQGSVNVRADYPREENAWEKKAPVLCVLPPGTKVKVGGKPIQIQGGGVWVPVRDAWIQP